MAELNYTTKVHGPVTLRPGYNDGKVVVEVWFDNRVIAKFQVEYLWDFLSDVFEENPPKNVPGSRGREMNYLDRGRRYNQMLAANWLANAVSPGNPAAEETMEKIKEIGGMKNAQI